MSEIAIGVSLYLIDTVLSFLHQESSLRKEVRKGIEEIKTQLQTMEAYLKGLEGLENDEGRKDRATNVQGIAYDIEDALDEFMIEISMNHHTHSISRKLHDIKHCFTDQLIFHEFSDKISGIQSKINKFMELEPIRNPQRIADNPFVTPHIPEEDDIFGFDEIKGTFFDQLITGVELRRRTLAIDGLPGSGKSLLVKKVCNDKRVRGEFDCHAWVHVTRSFQLDDLLRNLWSQLCLNKPVGILSEGGSNIGENLKQYLEKKRYIVVLDDVWSKQDWDSIANTLPNGLAGSAIIVTTRSQDVASSCVQSDRHIYHLDGLSSNVAMDLFSKKAFPASNGTCPPELYQLSRQIIERCERLPLLIVTVAGLLSKKQQLPIEWKKLYDSLGSEIGMNSNLSVVKNTLFSSYYDLPSHLKSCFLYMGLFPEKFSIARGRLIRLWIAEGFVKKMGGKTLEEVAEDYLKELINRYLIIPSVMDFDGRARSCRVHNLVCEFIINIYDRNKFSAVLSKSNTNSEIKDIKGYRRLSVHLGYTIDKSQNKYLDHARTFLMLGCERMNFETFKLLKVLDLEDSGLDNFPEEITQLFLMKYLSFKRTNIGSLPPSIKKLVHLETLDLKHTRVTLLPKEIFKLEKLRHLLGYRSNGNNYAHFDSTIGVEVFAGIGDLRAIQKLSLIKVSQHH